MAFACEKQTDELIVLGNTRNARDQRDIFGRLVAEAAGLSSIKRDKSSEANGWLHRFPSLEPQRATSVSDQ